MRNHHKIIIPACLASSAPVGLAACSNTTHASARNTQLPAQSQAPPPAPSPSPTFIGARSGNGNETTPTFQAPATGDYTVQWSYSGNTDPSFGNPANFIINATDSAADSLGLPNDVQTSGSGSTEVTNASGPESFNVQAIGQWTITLKAAP